MSLTFLEIQQQFSQLRDASVRHRDIANRLNISEAELIAAHVGQDNQSQRLSVTRLNTQWPNMIAAVNRLGKVMALTRNEACVHEKIGQYENISCEGGHVGLVLGGPIDLRVFYHSWSSGFAVVEKHDAKTQHSLQFFDKTGTAIHKIYLKEAKEAEFFQFASEFAAEEQTPALTLVSAASLVVTEKPDADIDVAGFNTAWEALEDTHDFYILLKKYKVSRTQGLRLAAKKFAYPIKNDSVEQVLNTAVADKTPIMVFVGNPGMIQIHMGEIFKVVKMGDWLNVMDADFNLHLRSDLIAQSWVVKKPTKDGIVTSVELFDAQGECIATLFGARKPGIPELETWRTLVENLPHEEQLACTN